MGSLACHSIPFQANDTKQYRINTQCDSYNPTTHACTHTTTSCVPNGYLSLVEYVCDVPDTSCLQAGAF